jgi:hypothetical protein
LKSLIFRLDGVLSETLWVENGGGIRTIGNLRKSSRGETPPIQAEAWAIGRVDEYSRRSLASSKGCKSIPTLTVVRGKMKSLPKDISDDALIKLIDEWAGLMEAEDYDAAFQFTEQVPEMKWTPELYRKVIKSYGDCLSTQKVTVQGKPTDISQRKKVDRWEPNALSEVGEIWYDLNIDGFASDLTATFRICQTPEGIILRLNDVHVM